MANIESLTFFVADTATMTRIAKIDSITNINIGLQLNAPGTVSFTVNRSSTPLAIILTPLDKCILVYRDGVLAWSGPILSVSESLSGPTRQTEITAIGWFELLNHRLIRTNPGYSLATSGITFTNPGFESALSGWSATNGTAARDTVVVQTGTGSLRLSENIANGTWTGTTVESSMSANALGSTPVSGRRYRLNFSARARRNAKYVNGIAPYLEVLESGVRVGFKELGDLFVSGGVLDYWDTTGAFFSTFVEWQSSGIAPTFRFAWDVNPSQFYQWDGSGVDYWAIYNGTMTPFPGPMINVTLDGIGFFQADLNNMPGQLDTSKSYTATIRYLLNQTPSGSDNFSVFDSTGTTLATTTYSTTPGVWSTRTLTFTPNANQPIRFYVSGLGVPNTGLMFINNIIIKEAATNTDPLLNVDNVSLQEFAGDGIYSAQDAGSIALALLNKTNSDGTTRITPGSVQTTQPRTITYQRFTNIGKEIKSLSDIEAGYDFVVDPITRALNIFNRTTAGNFPVVPAGLASGPTWVYSADRTTNLRFDYGGGKDNLSSITRRKDGSTVVNRLNVKGKYALGQASDATSQSTYGIFEDLISLPDVIDASTSVLPYYANAEISFRKNPKVTYDISVKPGDNSPKLFIDFNIGDRGTINVPTGLFTDNASITQTVRVFGVQLNVDAEGNERISGLQLSA